MMWIHVAIESPKKMPHDSRTRNPIFQNGSECAVKNSRGFLVKIFLAKVKGSYTITGKRNGIMRLPSNLDVEKKVKFKHFKDNT